MLPDDKSGLLLAFLGGLPSDIAMRLARAVEVDRLMDGHVLPHDVILNGLRPALRDQVLNGRTPTPLRLFYQPFEDILTSAPRAKKQKAAVARTSVLPVWLWVSRTLMPGEAQAYVSDVKKFVVMQKLDEAVVRAAEFWLLAGTRIAENLADPSARKATRIALNGDAVVGDAEEMALLMRAGADVIKIQTVLPKPVAHLNEELLWQLRGIYDELVERNPDAAPYVAVIAMNRLTRPWEALKLPLLICRGKRDTLIAQTDMGLVGEILFGRMEDLQAAIMGVRHPQIDADKLLEQVSSFAELSTAIVKEIEVRRDGEWGQRLLKERGAVGSVMDGLMDRAPKELAAALPVQKGPGPKRADFGRAPDPDRQIIAQRYVKLVAGSRNFAAAASFGAKQKSSHDEMRNYMRRHNEDLVNELRGGDAAKKAIAEGQFEYCIELTATLFGEEDAELLRRRVKAAQSAAA